MDPKEVVAKMAIEISWLNQTLEMLTKLSQLEITSIQREVIEEMKTKINGRKVALNQYDENYGALWNLESSELEALYDKSAQSLAAMQSIWNLWYKQTEEDRRDPVPFVQEMMEQAQDFGINVLGMAKDSFDKLSGKIAEGVQEVAEKGTEFMFIIWIVIAYLFFKTGGSIEF